MTDGESDTTDWSRYRDPTEGVRINDEGKYECKDCDEALQATGKVQTTDTGRRRAVWLCLECRNRYNI